MTPPSSSDSGRPNPPGTFTTSPGSSAEPSAARRAKRSDQGSRSGSGGPARSGTSRSGARSTKGAAAGGKGGGANKTGANKTGGGRRTGASGGTSTPAAAAATTAPTRSPSAESEATAPVPRVTAAAATTAPTEEPVRRSEAPAAAATAATATRPVAATSATATSTSRAPRRVMGYRRQRFEARKVRRLVRHVDPWSMLKLSVLVALCMWLITMIAAFILWSVARNSGTITSIEDFVNNSLQLRDWKLDGEFLFRQFSLITLLLALGSAAAMVVASLVFNLISDIIGGVWISVIEEETARPITESSKR